MKTKNLHFAILIAVMFGSYITATGQVKMGDNPTVLPNAASLLELESTNKGLLLPRIPLLSNLSSGALAGAPNGMMVYVVDQSAIYLRKGGAWTKIEGAADNLGNHQATILLDMNDNDITEARDITASGWVTSNGWKHNTGGGGFFMSDNTWIRTFGNKSFYHNVGIMRTDGEFQVHEKGTAASRFYVDLSGNAAFPRGNVSIGTAAISSSKLDVQAEVGDVSGLNDIAAGHFKFRYTPPATSSVGSVSSREIIAQLGGHWTVPDYSSTHGFRVENRVADAPSTTDRIAVVLAGIYDQASNGTAAISFNNPRGGAQDYGLRGNGKVMLSGNVFPGSDNAFSLGLGDKKWSVVYAANGTIQTSDRRYKNNINELSYGLSDVMKLRPVSYNWKSEPSGKIKLGLIAQELQQVIPEVVNVGEDAEKTLGVNYSDLIPVLIKAIQEQQKQIDELKQKLDSIK